MTPSKASAITFRYRYKPYNIRPPFSGSSTAPPPPSPLSEALLLPVFFDAEVLADDGVNWEKDQAGFIDGYTEFLAEKNKIKGRSEHDFVDRYVDAFVDLDGDDDADQSANFTTSGNSTTHLFLLTATFSTLTRELLESRSGMK